MGKPRHSDSDSSGEEDGSAEWKAAIASIASTTTYGGANGSGNGSTSAAAMTKKPVNDSTSNAENDDVDDEDCRWKPQKLKHYHIKAQQILDEIVGKTLEIVSDHIHVPNKDDEVEDCGVRLFKNAPPGIVFDHRDELQGPKKKPRILPGEEIDEKSKKFRRKLQSVVVDGADVLFAAKKASQKSLDRLEAKEAAAKAKAKTEEERVAELKRIRGERWLPSISRNMQVLKIRRR